MFEEIAYACKITNHQWGLGDRIEVWLLAIYTLVEREGGAPIEHLCCLIAWRLRGVVPL